MTQKKPLLYIETNHIRPALCRASVVVDKSLVSALYNEAVLSQQKTVHAQGFPPGAVPTQYIKENFNLSLIEHLKEFIFHYFVISFLNKELRRQKILTAGEPRLAQIEIQPEHDARFEFDLTTFPTIPFQNWKYFPFKAPKRKKYKDLDRQVSGFIKQEKELSKQEEHFSVEVDDWVCFDVSLVDEKKQPVFGEIRENLWLKIGNEIGDEEFHRLFAGKQIGDQFYSDADCLQNYFSSVINTHYTFLVTVKDLLSHKVFCFNQFKRHFKVKTNKEMFQRMVEVFSFRNDLSQRQLMIEESLKLLLNRHQFSVPKYLILRQEKQVLDSVKDNPDYQVYKIQKDFRDYVRKLAEKQIKETILLDQLSYKENINIDHEDIKNYLNLTKRPRMKDFIYFEHPETKIDGREMPISSELLKQACLREKALNYVIHHLTKK